MKDNILFIAPSAYTLGGVQTWLDYLVPGLQDHGFSSAIALTSGKYHDHDKYLQAHPFSNHYSIHNKTGTIQGRIDALQDLVVRTEPAAIVVVNIVDVYPAIEDLRRQGKTNTRVVASLHGIHPGLIDDIHRYRNVIDAVISTNRLTERLICEKARFEQSQSLYAPYGVSMGLPSANAPSTKPLTVAYVGRLEEDQKRISDLLRIFSDLIKVHPNLRILIAGDGDQSQAFTGWIRQPAIRDKVEYFGVLGYRELSQRVYREADILLLTSHWETGPIVAWEAMSHEVLLVSSRYIGLEDEGSLIDDKNCMLFDIGDTKQAVEKILLANDPALRERLTRSAKELISTRYSVNCSIDAWAKCLRTIIKRSPKTYTRVRQIKTDQGRLSRLLGSKFSERVRRLLNIRYEHRSVGSEWPHSYSALPSGSADLKKYFE